MIFVSYVQKPYLVDVSCTRNNNVTQPQVLYFVLKDFSKSIWNPKSTKIPILISELNHFHGQVLVSLWFVVYALVDVDHQQYMHAVDVIYLLNFIIHFLITKKSIKLTF